MMLSCRHSDADSCFYRRSDVVTVLPAALWPAPSSLAVLLCIRLTSTAAVILPHDATTTHLFAMATLSVRSSVCLSLL